MTASGADSGEKPQNEGENTPAQGAYEAPPIEQSQGQPSYDLPPSPPAAPDHPGYQSGYQPGYPSGYQGDSQGYEAPSSYPPTGYSAPAAPSYPPPAYQPPSYPPPGYQESGQYPGGQYGGSYPPPPPPPPQSQYGAGQYGDAYGYGAPAQGTNTMAIASLVASIVGVLCGVGSIVGIVLGAMALNQIKRTRQEGYGLAVAGIVVGVATLIISMIWFVYAWR